MEADHPDVEARRAAGVHKRPTHLATTWSELTPVGNGMELREGMKILTVSRRLIYMSPNGVSICLVTDRLGDVKFPLYIWRPSKVPRQPGAPNRR